MVLRMDSLYRLKKSDLRRASIALSEAFADDPVWNKVFEGIPNFSQRFETFYETPLRFCLTYGEVYGTSGRLEGILGIVPGRYADMTMWRIICSGALLSTMKLGVTVAKRMSPLGKAVPRDRIGHMGKRPFLYLFLLGVVPEHQKKGFGKKLLTDLLDACDIRKLPVYLETETEVNVRMYERFGFKVLKEIVLDRLEVPLWEMIREPR
jgi:ribosomal protein S18 acetylase RimI-like enzyme